MQHKPNKRVTIYDLAQELNVSPSTVSRALNDHRSIGEVTTTRIKELAKSRGYRTNALASGLRSQKSKTIGILVPWINRPFISNLISGIEESAQAAGYTILISQTGDSSEREITNAKVLVDSRVQIMIVSLAMETTQYSHFEDIISQGTTVIFVDRIPKNYCGHQVLIDNYQTGFDATRHLIDLGRKRIAILSGSLKQKIYQDRYEGYVAALTESGLPVLEEFLGISDILTSEEGAVMIETMLQSTNPPDAVFSTNDSAAIGAMQYALARGLRIPEDLAFIGMNDDPVCTVMSPALSSMTHPAAEMGKIAVTKALEFLDLPDKSIPATFVVRLNTEVIARASSVG